jgi:hypothetical protein
VLVAVGSGVAVLVAVGLAVAVSVAVGIAVLVAVGIGVGVFVGGFTVAVAVIWRKLTARLAAPTWPA